MMNKNDVLKMVNDHNGKIYNLQKEYDNKKLGVSDWFNYNQKAQPLVREGWALIEKLHTLGYTDYKINAQTGIIK